LERIALIRKLQQQGLTLAEIAVQLGGRSSEEALPQPSLWLTYRLGDEVTIQVRADCPAWRLRQIRSIVGQLASLFSDKIDVPKGEETDHEHAD
jgi:DNA-binding transcriptional MerR regulator